MQYTILKSREVEAIEAISKLVVKAAKYGNEQIHFKKVAETTSEVEMKAFNPHGDYVLQKVKVPAVIYELTGAAPKIEGYDFLARIEFLAENNATLVHEVPGAEDRMQQKFRNTDTTCEHCHTVRKRKDVYIVEETATGKQLQIGRTCLRDYLGIDNPNNIVKQFEFLQDFTSSFREDYGINYGSYLYDHNIMTVANAAIRIHGYQNEGGTASLVNDVLYGATNEIARKLKANITNEDSEEAKKAKAWLLEQDDSNNYFYNIQQLLKASRIEAKHLNLLTSAVHVYRKAMYKEEMKKLERATRKNEHVGNIGDKIEIKNAQVAFYNIYEGAYGEYALVKMIDEQGRLFVTFTTSTAIDFSYLHHHKDTERRTFTAKVKKHDEYEGDKQTVVNYIKAV